MVSEFARPFSAVLAPVLKAAFQSHARRTKRPELVRELSSASEEALNAHLGWVAGWSSSVQTPAMTGPVDLHQATTPLLLSNVPRRFSGSRGTEHAKTEQELLLTNENVVVTGGPGAGKTTLMKRLVQLIFTTSPNDFGDGAGCPVVVSLRKYKWERDGRNVSDDEDEGNENDDDGHSDQFWNILLGEVGVSDEAATEAGLNLAGLTASILNEISATVVLDGLDEVPLYARGAVQEGIRDLTARTKSARLLVTCRTGDYQSIEGLREYELMPLSRSDIRLVATGALGLERAESFLKSAGTGALGDLLERPLFLAQLLVLYEYEGDQIPGRPSAMYRQFVRLMVQEWDRHRGIGRASRYASFDIESKLEFLEALSHHLTLRSEAARFSHEQLTIAYGRLHGQFGLPYKEAEQVAREIEGHTGLILQSGFEHFEFAHLSLQEYLCAEFLREDRLDQEFKTYLASHPAPIAVATALSRFPDRYLARVVSEFGTNASPTVVRSYLYRMAQERPRFSADYETGVLALRLISQSKVSDPEIVGDLMKCGELRNALLVVLDSAGVRQDKSSVVITPHYSELHQLRMPVAVHREMAEALAADGGLG